MSDTKDYKWYIVHTQNGYEKKIRERIDKRVKENGMEDLIVDIYIPSQMVSVTKNGKKVNKEEFSYPGYVFVKMIMNDATQSMIRRTPGVSGFIGSHATTKEELRKVKREKSKNAENCEFFFARIDKTKRIC